MQEKHSKSVVHPKHYNSHPSGVECITVVQDFGFNIGTAIKHLWRAGLKPDNPEIQDLRKAIQYITFEIQRLESRLCVRCKSEQSEDPSLLLCKTCLTPMERSRDDSVSYVLESPKSPAPTAPAASSQEAPEELPRPKASACLKCGIENGRSELNGMCNPCWNTKLDRLMPSDKTP